MQKADVFELKLKVRDWNVSTALGLRKDKMIDENNILETINMIKLHNLDIRTVTLA